MNEIERAILELLSKNLLITKSELYNRFGSDGIELALQKLRDGGLIKKVESLGTCFVITKDGIKKVKK
jgi:chromosome segregation and condensation protein ScpB